MKKSKMTKKIRIALLAMSTVLVMVGLCGCKSAVSEPEAIINPLTGIEVADEDTLPGRPIQVSIDNVGAAVPQSNLSKADLVYEFPVEGLQTRLQAIYYSQFPEFFGPVRSTRPYFIDTAREYKAIFIGHGWSGKAKKMLLSDMIPYINAMNSEVPFYRVKDKPAPHNSYIEWKNIKAKIDKEGWWDEKQEIEPFGFISEEDMIALHPETAPKNEDGEQAEIPQLDPESQLATAKPAKKADFEYQYSKFEYTYDADKDLYTRTINNGEPYVDKETGEPITMKNILVQYVSSDCYDAKGRLKINMTKGGKAKLFTQGKVIEGTWSRSDLDSRTQFIYTIENKGEDNEKVIPMTLTPGNSWVEVIDQTCKLSFE